MNRNCRALSKTIIIALMVMMVISFMPSMNSKVYAAKEKKPAKVTGVKAKKSENKIKVTWKKAKNAKKYQVYVATGKKFKKVKTLKKTSYSFKVKKGNTYKIKVRAIAGKRKGKFSKTVKVKIPSKTSKKVKGSEEKKKSNEVTSDKMKTNGRHNDAKVTTDKSSNGTNTDASKDQGNSVETSGDKEDDYVKKLEAERNFLRQERERVFKDYKKHQEELRKSTEAYTSIDTQQLYDELKEEEKIIADLEWDLEALRDYPVPKEDPSYSQYKQEFDALVKQIEDAYARAKEIDKRYYVAKFCQHAYGVSCREYSYYSNRESYAMSYDDYGYNEYNTYLEIKAALPSDIVNAAEVYDETVRQLDGIEARLKYLITEIEYCYS